MQVDRLYLIGLDWPLEAFEALISDWQVNKTCALSTGLQDNMAHIFNRMNVSKSCLKVNNVCSYRMKIQIFSLVIF